MLETTQAGNRQKMEDEGVGWHAGNGGGILLLLTTKQSNEVAVPVLFTQHTYFPANFMCLSAGV